MKGIVLRLANPRLRRAAWIGAAVFLGISFYRAVWRSHNDFTGFHIRMGESFRCGVLFEDHYMVFRAMVDGGLSLLGVHLAAALSVLVAFVGLGVTIVLWNRMAAQRRPLPPAATYVASVVALLICASYVFRDLDDTGLQIVPLAMMTVGVHALVRGKALAAGGWFGTAAAYRVTPLLILPFLLYKRQWRAAAWMIVFLVGLNFLPALVHGWDWTVQKNGAFLRRLAAVATAEDPADTTFDEQNVRNQSLQFAIARYLQTYPPGDARYLDRPGFVQFGNLDNKTTGLVVKAVFAALALVLAWRFRRPYAADPEGPDPAPEFATVVLLAALLSPVCALDHLTFAFPALLLTTRAFFDSPPRRWRTAVFVSMTAIMLLSHRAVLGDLRLVVRSYKEHTLAALLLLLLVLTIPPRDPAAAA